MATRKSKSAGHPVTGSRTGKAGVEEQVEALHALRDLPEQAQPAIEAALAGRNNYVASKAAALAAELHLAALVPQLATAFDRFMTGAAESDPQCWAKVAIAKALKDLGHTNSAVFERGALHIQMEPVWGGQADTAGPLRAACLLALPGCQIDGLTMTTFLADALADPDKNVRVEAALALAHTGIASSAAILRLKALLGDDEPEVVGQCLASILELTAAEGVEFAQRFLDSPEPELQVEAVAALAHTHAAGAIEKLTTFWQRKLAPEVRTAAHTILAASRHREAFPPLPAPRSR
jgi:hypothetical protein